MEPLTGDDLRRARQDLDDVIREIQAIDEFKDFLAEPTMQDVATAARRHPLVYLTAAQHGGLARVGLPQVDLLSVVHHAGATVHLHQPGEGSSVLHPEHANRFSLAWPVTSRPSKPKDPCGPAGP